VSLWLVGGIITTAGWGVTSLSRSYGSSAGEWGKYALLIALSAAPLSAVAAIHKRCYQISWVRSIGAIMITAVLALLTAFLLSINGLMPEQLFFDYYRTHYPQLEPRHAGGLIAMAVIATGLIFWATLLVFETTVPFLVWAFRKARQKQP
jgi:hypothetical protein